MASLFFPPSSLLALVLARPRVIVKEIHWFATAMDLASSMRKLTSRLRA